MSLGAIGSLSPETLGTIGSVSGSTLTSSGTSISDDHPCLGTTITSMGTTVSSALNGSTDSQNQTLELEATQLYMESMNQDELHNMLEAVENREKELIGLNDAIKTNKTLVKKL